MNILTSPGLNPLHEILFRFDWSARVPGAGVGVLLLPAVQRDHPAQPSRPHPLSPGIHADVFL